MNVATSQFSNIENQKDWKTDFASMVHFGSSRAINLEYNECSKTIVMSQISTGPEK